MRRHESHTYEGPHRRGGGHFGTTSQQQSRPDNGSTPPFSTLAATLNESPKLSLNGSSRWRRTFTHPGGKWFHRQRQQKRRYSNLYSPRDGLHKKVIIAFGIFAAIILIVIHLVLLHLVWPSSSDTTTIEKSKNVNPFLRKNIADSDITNNNNNNIDFLSSSSASSFHLTPLQYPRDYEKFTIRINTWRRIEQLQLSVDEHSKCDGVEQIQIVWCDVENEPPLSIANHSSGKVVIEKHAVNSLNERFHIILPTPTLGILSIDDDVYRPCEAIDAGFFKWTQYPHRMVGYDTRLHIQNGTKWEYGYLSESLKLNSYSITLPRYSFLHRDYMNLYMKALPRPIFESVTENFNCEDIAMSFFISALTGGEPPLLADYWAVKMQVKLYTPHMISHTTDHKSLRDECVDAFAQQLGLKSGIHQLKASEALHYDSLPFAYGARPGEDKNPNTSPRYRAFTEKMEEWVALPKDKFLSRLQEMRIAAMRPAVALGLVEKTKEWENRWGGAEGENEMQPS